jgi:hypothetical protein
MQDKDEVSNGQASSSELSKDAGNWVSSHVEKPKGLESLLNKEVSTCDNVAIRSISALENGWMFIICTPLNRKYEIPTYFVMQYDQNSVLVDICAGDLEHYRPQISFWKTRKCRQKCFYHNMIVFIIVFNGLLQSDCNTIFILLISGLIR